MLSCRACFRRHVQVLHLPTANALRSRTHVSPLSQQLGTRRQSTRHDALSDPSSPAHASRYPHDIWKESSVAANQRRRESRALWQTRLQDSAPVTPNLARLPPRDPRMSEQDWSRRRRELRHLQDPLELAEFVAKELQKDKVYEMKQLVIMASHSMECVVSWNHIINYLLTKSKVTDALKIYNDV